MAKRAQKPPPAPPPGTVASQVAACVLAAAIAWHDAVEEGDGRALDVAATALHKATGRYLRARANPGAKPTTKIDGTDTWAWMRQKLD